MKKIGWKIFLGIFLIGSVIIYHNYHQEYTITFDSLGGSQVNSSKIRKSELLTKPEDPIKDGYKFIAWYYNNQEYDFKKPVEDNITLKAKWEKIEEAKIKEVMVGESLTLETPPKDDAKLTWQSSDKNLAKVTNLGEVTGLKEGNVTITVKDKKEILASYQIKVVASYKIVLEPIVYNGTDIIQYKFKVTKNSKKYTKYQTFTLGGEVVHYNQGTIPVSWVEKLKTTSAEITLNNTQIVPATVVIKELEK